MTWPLTPWFKRSVAPARPGHYLVRDGFGCIDLMHWDGQWWRYLEGNAGVTGIESGSMWAGLAFDPSRAVESQDAETGCPGMWVPTR